MNKLEQAARQALDALENAYENGFLTGITGLKTIDIITALREALAKQAEQPVSKEYQDHLVNQSFDWAAMAAKHQFMEGYRIGLAEMREKCAKVCEAKQRYNAMHANTEFAAAIRAINFEGDTGFRPVSEMVAEQADSEQWSPDDMAYRPGGLSMEQAEHEPVAWHHPQCDGQCIACLIEKAVQDAYGTQGRDYMLRHINAAAPVRTKDLTDDEIADCGDFAGVITLIDLKFARAVIAADREKNK